MTKEIEEIYKYVCEMQEMYIKQSKMQKDKEFTKKVDAILTATTLIKMKIKNVKC